MSRADRIMRRRLLRAEHVRLMRGRRERNRLYDTYGTPGSGGLQYGQWLSWVQQEREAPIVKTAIDEQRRGVETIDVAGDDE